MRFHIRNSYRVKTDILVFCIAMSLYALNRFFLKYAFDGFIGYILKCHFNDFLGGICINAYIDFIILNSKYYLRYKFFKLYQIMLISLVCGLLWEYIFPLFWEHGTSDYLDVFAYLIGGIVYWCIITTIRKKKKNGKT